MARLIHLNGPPGVGKSTLARRYVAQHHGVLDCDVDVLRGLIGGWDRDFARAGALIRPAALAMIEAYLASGHDVVLPQMLIDPAELARFEGCALRAGAAFVEIFLMTDLDDAVSRFARRGAAEDADPWHRRVQALVTEQGGDAVLERYHEGLRELLARRRDAVAISSVEGEIAATYDALLAAVASVEDQRPPRSAGRTSAR